MINSYSRVLSTAAAVLMLLAVFASRAFADTVCSNEILKGHYAHLIQGTYGPDMNPFDETYMSNAVPFQGIQMLEFDGKGGITGQESLVASGAEITNNNGKHFAPVVGSFTINADCTGIGYICANHTTGTVSGGPNTCTAKTIGTSGFVWEDFAQVTIVVSNRGKTFHMLVIPPYDAGGIIRTISSTGTRLEGDADQP